MTSIGKGVVVILILMSIWSLYVTHRAAADLPQGQEAVAAVRQAGRPQYLAQDRLQDAIEPSRKYKHSHLARVTRAGLIEFQLRPKPSGRLSRHEIVEAARRAIERETLITYSDFKKGIGSLATIATTAPFIGLFGTVIGIINAFRGMAVTGSGGIAAVSAGIAEALVTTALGLVRRHPGGLDVQLLHQQPRALPGRDVELLLGADRLLHQEARRQPCNWGPPVSKLGSGENAVKSDINVTPLVDVCLVLLIIFMVVTPMLQSGVDVALPETRKPEKMPESAEAAHGRHQAERRRLRRPGLGAAGPADASGSRTIYAQTPEKDVVLKADRRLKYKDVRKVMRADQRGRLHRRRPDH